MFRCSYFAWWFWLELKQGEVLAPEHCPDGPWCGCDQHRGLDDYDSDEE